MSRKSMVMLSLLALVITSAAFAEPRKDDMAVSVNFGPTGAFDSNFDDIQTTFNGTWEYYSKYNLSFRGMLGWAEFDADRGDDAEILYSSANVIYYWDTGMAWPFVAGGLGLYDRDAPSHPFDSDLEIGMNVGGGVDLWVDEKWAIKFEGTIHGFSGDEPDDFWTVTIGAKRLF